MSLLIARNRAARITPATLSLDADYLRASFGWVRVPTHLWRAMRRNAAWIELTLVSEWARLMRDYAKGQERNLAEETIIRSMQWADRSRASGLTAPRPMDRHFGMAQPAAPPG